MKIIKSIDEKFTSNPNLNTHYAKHVIRKQEFANMSMDEYEQAAEQLAKTPVDHKNIFGYVSQTREGKYAYCKYNKQNGYFTVYTYKNGTPYTITFFTKTWRDFTGDKAIEYYDEIPVGM